MAVQIKHAFVSLKGDGSDLTQVQPSNWNANHVLTQATGKVLGRVTAGAGATEEIDWSAFGRSWLNAADANAAQGLLGPVSSIANQAVTYKKLQLASAAARLIGSNGNPALNILGAANNGVGLIRLQVADTSTFTTGQRKIVAGVVGTVEANDSWIITVVDATHIDLQGSAFANVYVSGGTIGGGFEEISLGSGLRMAGSILSTPAFPPLGSTARKIITVTGNTGFSVTAAAAVLADGSGNYSTVALNSPTVNVATNGGLDAMEGALTLAGPAWLSVWAICKADGSSPKILCNYSDTTITTFPSGYTQKALLGHLRVSSSNLLHGSIQKGNRFQYVIGLAQTTQARIMALGPAGAVTPTSITWVAVATGAQVPPTASEIFVVASNTWMQGSNAAIAVAPNNNYGARSDIAGNISIIEMEANSQPPFNVAGNMLLESTNIYWAGNANGAALLCTGYIENL